MGARKHTMLTMRATAADDKNSRRYEAAEIAASEAHRRSGDMFPEARVDPTIDGDQRFTTRETDLWCRNVAGVTRWDLDVAACEEAHLAEQFLTKSDDGLTRPWFGRVWCNPPFSDITPWVEKAWVEIRRPAEHDEESGRPLYPSAIAMLLPASRTEQQWWQAFVEPFRDGRSTGPLGGILSTCFLPGRTRFGHPGNPEGVGVGSPPFGCVLLVWRRP